MTSGWIWTLLNLYLLISLCAILFDLWIMLTASHRQRARGRREARLKALLERQLSLLGQGREQEEATQHKLYRRLRSIGDVLAFCVLADAYSADGDARFALWVSRSGAMFGRLCQYYGRKQKMYRASFAWLLASCRQDIPAALPFLLACTAQRGSIYCRENALTALYRGGSVKGVVQALKRMSREDVHHSQKLLCDGLLSFKGDREELCAQLWRQFGSFTPDIRLALVDFMRLLGADYCRELLPLLDDPATDDELCYAILRYYGRCRDEGAYRRMLAFLEKPRGGLWEYAAVSASALRAYPCGETVSALLEALGAHNWYVRYNAAESLVSMGLPESAYRPALEGEDRYAREILQYMLERRQLSGAAPETRKGGKSLVVS